MKKTAENAEFAQKVEGHTDKLGYIERPRFM
jgi:hypothetical protein